MCGGRFFTGARAFIYYWCSALRGHQFGLARSSTGVFEPPSLFLHDTGEIYNPDAPSELDTALRREKRSAAGPFLSCVHIFFHFSSPESGTFSLVNFSPLKISQERNRARCVISDSLVFIFSTTMDFANSPTSLFQPPLRIAKKISEAD